MSNASRARAKAMLQKKWDVSDLEHARHLFWLGKYDKCSDIIFPLVQRLVIEPLKDTEEYKDGERKPDLPILEQEKEESEPPWEAWEVPSFFDLTGEDIIPDTKSVERDENGYIIDK